MDRSLIVGCLAPLIALGVASDVAALPRPGASVAQLPLARIDVAAGDLVLPIPNGFCLNQYAPNVADHQTQNQAHLAPGTPIYRCKGSAPLAGMPSAFSVSVKNPTQRLAVSRSEFIKSALAEFESSEGITDLQRALREAQQHHSGLLSVGNHVLGADDNGVYYTTDMQVRRGASERTVTVMACVTIINGYIVSEQFVELPNSSDDSAPLFSWVRAETKQFIDANNGR